MKQATTVHKRAGMIATMVESLQQRLQRAMSRLGYDVARLSKESGVTYQGVRKPHDGVSKTMLMGTAAKISKVLRCNKYWLANGNVPPDFDGMTAESEGSEVDEAPALKALANLPLVGEVKGGMDGYLEEFDYPVGHGEGTVQYPTSDPEAYALRVRGDSMHPRYRAGEFVVVEPSIEPQEGDDVVVLCSNGRKLLKQLNWRRDGEVQLLSINNGYDPMTLKTQEITSIQLVSGRARRNALRK